VVVSSNERGPFCRIDLCGGAIADASTICGTGPAVGERERGAAGTSANCPGYSRRFWGADDANRDVERVGAALAGGGAESRGAPGANLGDVERGHEVAG